MIESPLLQKMAARIPHKGILALLKARLGTVPRDVIRRLEDILDEEKLIALTVLAAECPDLATFRKALPRKRPTKPSAKRSRST